MVRSKLLTGYSLPYVIWEDGRVTGGINKDKPLKHAIGKDGYYVRLMRVNLPPKFMHISRLLAEAFIPHPDNLENVHFSNGNNLDISLDNLIWASRSKLVKTAYDRGNLIPPMEHLERISKKKICQWCKKQFEYSYNNKKNRCCSRSCGSRLGHMESGRNIKNISDLKQFSTG